MASASRRCRSAASVMRFRLVRRRSNHSPRACAKCRAARRSRSAARRTSPRRCVRRGGRSARVHSGMRAVAAPVAASGRAGVKASARFPSTHQLGRRNRPHADHAAVPEVRAVAGKRDRFIVRVCTNHEESRRLGGRCVAAKDAGVPKCLATYKIPAQRSRPRAVLHRELLVCKRGVEAGRFVQQQRNRSRVSGTGAPDVGDGWVTRPAYAPTANNSTAAATRPSDKTPTRGRKRPRPRSARRVRCFSAAGGATSRGSSAKGSSVDMGPHG